MAEQRLHHAQVGAIVQEMACERMAKHMRAHLRGSQPGSAGKRLQFARKMLSGQMAGLAERGEEPFGLRLAAAFGKQPDILVHRGLGGIVERHQALLVAFAAHYEHDAQAKVLILTGAGDAWCAGQDLKLFFRDLDNKPVERTRAAAASHYWRWQKLFTYAKPTIAMVNGFCFGGGFTQLIACDFAIAAEDAQFGLSEVNWGILPGGFVSKALVEALGMRDAVWFAVTGETFDGRVAERARLINRAVPREQLRAETVALARRLMKINPEAIRATKQAVKNVRNMSDDAAVDYLAAKSIELRFLDREKGREKGMSQFLDEKTYRPGIQPYNRPTEKAS